MYKNFLRFKNNCTFTKLTKLSTFVFEAPRRYKQTMYASYDYNRCWVPADNNGQQQRQRQRFETQKRYKLLSYNILAQDLLLEHSHLYYKIEPWLLTWKQRLFNLQKEIVQLDPDILCLQEMQFNHLQQLVKKISGQKRLEYIFKKKTGFRTDGCAIIYNRDKFQLIDERGVEYYTEGVSVLNRENVAIIAKFKLKDEEPHKELIVATTHLLYNPRREDVRTAQVKKLLNILTEFANQQEQRTPILLTGDFNFESSSSSYATLTAAAEENGSSSENTCAASDNDELQMRALNFGCSTASTMQDGWITVDYILNSVSKQAHDIFVWNVYRLPLIEACDRVGPIPNKYLGSDHYSIGIEFSLM